MALKDFERVSGWDADTRETTRIDLQDTSFARSKCLSVIIPTLNEATNIAHLLLRLDRSLNQAGIFYEAILVDDLSTDKTVEIARQIKVQYGLPVRILLKEGRPGKSYSLMEGFAAARFDILAMIDGDLQYPPEALPGMLAMLGQKDIIIADRRASYTAADQKRGKMSESFDAIVGKRLFGIDADLQSGLKLFRKATYEQISLKPGRWSFDLEFVTLAKQRGFRLGNLPITFQERQGGQSKVSPSAVGFELLTVALRLKLWLVLNTLVNLLMCWGIVPRSEQFVAARHPQEVRQDEDPALHVLRNERDYYARWLKEEAELHTRTQQETDATEYANRAMQPLQFQGKAAYPFTPLAYDRSALRSFTRGQIFTIIGVALAWLAGVICFMAPTLVATIALIMILYLKNMIDTFRMVTQSLDLKLEDHIDDDIVHKLSNRVWPYYTILCPLYKEAAIVPQFVAAMTALDYPTDKLQILFLTEENDSETRQVILAMGLPPHFEVVTVPDGQPRTKPRACNYGLLKTTGDYIVIYDAEDIPDPLQLKKAVLTFANHNPDLACVQAKLNFYNPCQNILTRWFTIEYSLWFDLILPGMQQARMSLPLGGTSNHFRTSILRKLCAWDPFNVTEDCDLGLRLAQHHLHTVVLDSTTMEEANSLPKNWIRQRSRWIKGYMQTYLVHMRNPMQYLHAGRWREFLSLQFIIGGTPATFVINPIMWLMLAAYLGLRPFVAGTYQMLYPAPVFYAGMICLVFGNFLYIYTSLLACAKRGQYRLMIWTFTLPFYWIMMSMAAMMALFQLLFKPHYWEKTQHGLHLKHQQEPLQHQSATTRSFEASGIHTLHKD